MASVDDVLSRLRRLARPGGREGMVRFGSNPDRALGVRIPDIRALAKELGTDHGLALSLWRTQVHEARILASMVADPQRVTERQTGKRNRALNRAAAAAAGRLAEDGASPAARWVGRDAFRELTSDAVRSRLR